MDCSVIVPEIQAAIDALDGINLGVRLVQFHTMDDAVLVFRRDSEDNWFLAEVR